MMLYEAGCFQLDHPVGRYIPAFRETPVWKGGALSDVEAQSTPMTVKQLMTHTAGLTYGFMHTNVIDEAYRNAGFEVELKTTLGRGLTNWRRFRCFVSRAPSGTIVLPPTSWGGLLNSGRVRHSRNFSPTTFLNR